jgi:hypothetical protein
MALDELGALSDEQVLDVIFLGGFLRQRPSSPTYPGVASAWTWCARRPRRWAARAASPSRVGGAGTTVRLDLPLNIALARIMVV